jgi:hypothetical protein
MEGVGGRTGRKVSPFVVLPIGSSHQRRVQQPVVTDSRRASGLLDQPAVNFQDLVLAREKHGRPALCQSPISIAPLLEHVVRDFLH